LDFWGFFTTIEMIMWLSFYSIDTMFYINWFCNVKPTFHLWMNPTLLWCIILFMCHWIYYRVFQLSCTQWSVVILLAIQWMQEKCKHYTKGSAFYLHYSVWALLVGMGSDHYWKFLASWRLQGCLVHHIIVDWIFTPNTHLRKKAQPVSCYLTAHALYIPID
jgi:hypothetical protein